MSSSSPTNPAALIATGSPAQIDTELARLQGEREDIETRLAASLRDGRRYTEEKPAGGTHRANYWFRSTPTEVVEQLREKLVSGEIESYNHSGVERIINAIETRIEEIDAVHAQERVLNGEFAARNGWTRAFLCTNAGGHIHRSQGCPTLRITTSIGWVITVEVEGQEIEVSGMTEDQIIDLAGESACTVCYPDAPVTDRPSRIQDPEKVAARKAREVASAAKKAKAAKAGIVDPETGEELRILSTFRGTEVVKTERSAAIALVDALWYQKHYSEDENRAANIVTLLAALAHKHDTTVEVERAAADKRLAARERREG